MAERWRGGGDRICVEETMLSARLGSSVHWTRKKSCPKLSDTLPLCHLPSTGHTASTASPTCVPASGKPEPITFADHITAKIQQTYA